MSDRIDTALVQVFGAETLDYERYQRAAYLRAGGMYFAGYGPSLREVQEEVEQGRQKAITTLEEIVLRFQEELDLTPSDSPHEPRPAAKVERNRKVFVVHGRDEAARESVARFLERLDFKPIILHEQPNQGRTVIEKVEDHGEVGFAVVLLTPDDEGCLKGDTPRPRPRQNVLLELGYFVGRLGRDHVCALKAGELELPSDFGGVVWETFDGTGGGWKQKLGKELEAAGYEFDWNKVMRS